ncbi:hypothetical protein [Corynebacterium marinum]|uniref:Uncharacterized protein n=2 Tax=Corynebacterium marinum TaxID=349751 RepID=A0A0B6THG6_9CORY|nr:hypothetical protein [Corynebacterium marinum]AJK69367.1 hypothetical protein B840_08850 [Corynebacterium marinum DSM 44953]NLF92236.1 hypothetical protein [Corynebacterium marinum]GGO16291.1 hypothetical protein GCM10010980_12510 [Corynebacterium marinum]
MTTLAPTLARWLGAADSSVPDHPWETPDAPAYPAFASDVARTAVLNITGMPCAVRSRVETAMVVCIPSDSEISYADADPLTAEWFTAWRRCDDAGDGPRIACNQLITGTDEELCRLRTVVENLARNHGFTAELTLGD